MPNAVVIGGRGQSGLAIAERLLERGWEVTATTGVPEPETAGAAAGLRWVCFDRKEGDRASVVPEGTDVVVDVVSFTPADAANLIGLGDRIGAAVVLSTLSVYSDTEGRSLDSAETDEAFPAFPVPITEDQPTVERGDSGYSERKVALEQLLREEAPWPVTIVRPGAIHGRHSRHLREWYFIKRILDGRAVVVLPYRGAHVFQSTATVNMAELVALAAEKRAALTLNAADVDPPTPAAISEIIDGLMERETERVLVDDRPEEENVGNNPWAAPRPVIASMSLAERELGYRQVASYPDAMRDTLAWALAASRDRDWREVFPTLAGYPNDLFDYDAEDEYLARHR